MIKTAAVLGIALAIATGATIAAEDRESANFMLPGCRTFVSGHRTISEGYGVGACFGEFMVLAWAGRALPPELAYCLPERVTTGQMAQIVIRDLEKRPEVWHKDFIELAADALHRAFPCPKTGNSHQ
jgi:Rap1a immunity proteins